MMSSSPSRRNNTAGRCRRNANSTNISSTRKRRSSITKKETQVEDLKSRLEHLAVVERHIARMRLSSMIAELQEKLRVAKMIDSIYQEIDEELTREETEQHNSDAEDDAPELHGFFHEDRQRKIQMHKELASLSDHNVDRSSGNWFENMPDEESRPNNERRPGRSSSSRGSNSNNSRGSNSNNSRGSNSSNSRGSNSRSRSSARRRQASFRNTTRMNHSRQPCAA